ncbi:MAG: hypothetical protein ACKPFF_03055, partial [Planktothrix sp.]
MKTENKLVHAYGQEIPRQIAAKIAAVYPDFAHDKFLDSVLIGYDELVLMQRARHIANVLVAYLPQSYPDA